MIPMALLLLTACSSGDLPPSQPGGGGTSTSTRTTTTPTVPTGRGLSPCSECMQGPRLTGVNWFGFETGNRSPHGLWARDYRSMLKQIRDMGFNSVRLPFSNDMLDATPTGLQINAHGTDPYTQEPGLNVDLEGLSSLEILDKILDEARRIDLKVILDNHSRAHDGYMNETLWYTDEVPEEKWISDWVFLVKRYKDNPAVVAVDLNNEPHGNTTTGMKPPATWGYDEAGYGKTDWRKAAIACGKAILAANPDLIIIVEGVENYRGDNYWWGGNLRGVADYPIENSDIPGNRLWYSAHEYGPEVYNQPWFSAGDFPANLPAIWDSKFWFVQKQGVRPVFIGEFGIKEASAADPDSVPHKWLKSFMEHVGKSASWTFWSLNPNSGDTEGILKDDWVSVNQAKFNLIKPYLEPLP